MIKMNADNSALTPEEIERFRNMLLARREEILDNVLSIEGEALHKSRDDNHHGPSDLADEATDNYELENNLGLMDSERRLLMEIEAALERIEERTYGICQGNDERIPRGRLEAIPWARYCVACAALSEKGLLTAPDAKEEFIEYDETEELQ